MNFSNINKGTALYLKTIKSYEKMVEDCKETMQVAEKRIYELEAELTKEREDKQKLLDEIKYVLNIPTSIVKAKLKKILEGGNDTQ